MHSIRSRWSRRFVRLLVIGTSTWHLEQLLNTLHPTTSPELMSGIAILQLADQVRGRRLRGRGVVGAAQAAGGRRRGDKNCWRRWRKRRATKGWRPQVEEPCNSSAVGKCARLSMDVLPRRASLSNSSCNVQCRSRETAYTLFCLGLCRRVYLHRHMSTEELVLAQPVCVSGSEERQQLEV